MHFCRRLTRALGVILVEGRVARGRQTLRRRYAGSTWRSVYRPSPIAAAVRRVSRIDSPDWSRSTPCNGNANKKKKCETNPFESTSAIQSEPQARGGRRLWQRLSGCPPSRRSPHCPGACASGSDTDAEGAMLHSQEGTCSQTTDGLPLSFLSRWVRDCDFDGVIVSPTSEDAGHPVLATA